MDKFLWSLLGVVCGCIALFLLFIAFPVSTPFSMIFFIAAKMAFAKGE